MKILMTADTLGGVWTYTIGLARALQDYDVQIALATMGGPLSDDQRREIEQLPDVTLFESSFRLEWMDDPWQDVEEAGEWLLAIERAFQPDLVHLNGYVHASLPWGCPILVVGHSCVLSWWQAVKGAPAPPSWDRYRLAVSRGLRAADMVLAPTHAMLASLRRHYGVLATADVVPNGRDPSLYPQRKKEPFVLSAGHWDETGNIAALDSIASRLPWKVLVAGTAESPQGRVRNTRSLRPLGPLTPEQLGDYYSRASIYALPARYEPFGLSALEAALAGCALVLGDIPSLREVWRNAALYVDPQQPGSLRAAIQRLIAQPVLRMRMAARARDRALKYTPERMAQGYLRAYRALLPVRPREQMQFA